MMLCGDFCVYYGQCIIPIHLPLCIHQTLMRVLLRGDCILQLKRIDSSDTLSVRTILLRIFCNQSNKKSDGRSRIDREADDHQLLQLEEKSVVSSVATVLSDLCGPGEWMPMEKLHTELVDQYSTIWHHTRVRRYLTSEDWPGPESKGKPWYGLLMLLRKYPEHFVINTRSKGRITLEFVSLVSLLS